MSTDGHELTTMDEARAHVMEKLNQWDDFDEYNAEEDNLGEDDSDEDEADESHSERGES